MSRDRGGPRNRAPATDLQTPIPKGAVLRPVRPHVDCGRLANGNACFCGKARQWL
jgi:hypothetical protein